MKKIFNIILNIVSIILSIILVIVLVSWFQVNVQKRDYANIFGYTVFEVVTGSMSGTIEIDDYVIVKNTKDIKLKDIITFKDKKNYITHRVVEIRGDKIITRGDANNSNDIEITYDDIVGKVVFKISGAGIWKDVLLDYKVMIPIIVTLLLFALYFSIEEIKYRKVVHKADMNALKSVLDTDKLETKKVVKARLDKLKNEESKDK